MNRPLIIDNVNHELLEEQRQILSQIVCGEISTLMNPVQREALEGILIMLDEWSDRELENAK